MSFAIDANVLLHSVNSESPLHSRARAFLDRSAASDEPLCLTWGVISAFARISTHLGVFKNPLTPKEAVATVDELLDLPQARLLVEEHGFWKIYTRLSGELSPRGKAVPDTHLAALLELHGVRTLYTTDRDFRRYSGLVVKALP